MELIFDFVTPVCVTLVTVGATVFRDPKVAMLQFEPCDFVSWAAVDSADSPDLTPVVLGSKLRFLMFLSTCS